MFSLQPYTLTPCVTETSLIVSQIFVLKFCSTRLLLHFDCVTLGLQHSQEQLDSHDRTLLNPLSFDILKPTQQHIFSNNFCCCSGGRFFVESIQFFCRNNPKDLKDQTVIFHSAQVKAISCP